jgi:hypothetical protein
LQAYTYAPLRISLTMGDDRQFSFDVLTGAAPIADSVMEER